MENREVILDFRILNRMCKLDFFSTIIFYEAEIESAVLTSVFYVLFKKQENTRIFVQCLA